MDKKYSIALEPAYFDKTQDYPMGCEDNKYIITQQNNGVIQGKDCKMYSITEDIRNGNGRAVKSKLCRLIVLIELMNLSMLYLVDERSYSSACYKNYPDRPWDLPWVRHLQQKGLQQKDSPKALILTHLLLNLMKTV